MFHVEHSPDSFGAFLFFTLFTHFSQNYYTVFTKVRYNIANETRGNISKHNDSPKGRRKRK